MNRYFNVKKKESQTKETILAQINQVAKNNNHRVKVIFTSTSIVISSAHFMTTLHSGGERVVDMLCGGNLPTKLEDKLEAVTKMHEAEQEHVRVIDAILEVL